MKKVHVRKGLEVGKAYGGIPFTLGMAQFLDKDIQVTELKDGSYSVYEEAITKQMFSPEMVIDYTENPLQNFVDLEKLVAFLEDGHSIILPLNPASRFMAAGLRQYLYYINPSMCPLFIVEDLKRNLTLVTKKGEDD
jgi:hypothetical protein